MASAGERFHMPDGSVYIVRRPAAQSGGAFVEMEFVLPSGCVPPPPHVHRHQVEEYEVLAGRFDEVADEIRRVQAVCVARGKHLKVILETGELETYDNIRRASDLHYWNSDPKARPLQRWRRPSAARPWSRTRSAASLPSLLRTWAGL